MSLEGWTWEKLGIQERDRNNIDVVGMYEVLKNNLNNKTENKTLYTYMERHRDKLM